VRDKKPSAKTGAEPGGRASATIDASQDRRETPRIRMPKVEAEIVWLGLPVTVLEVGFGGLSIGSEHEFEVGEVHELRCRVSNRPPVILRVKVRHCRPEDGQHEPAHYVTGFQFVDVWVPGDHSAVDVLIEQLTIALDGDSGV
jgi:hypothetical protein